MPKAKALPKAQPKPKPKAKPGGPEPPEPNQPGDLRPFKPLGAPPGGRAESAWPLSGGEYPAPLYADPPPECVLGWALLRFLAFRSLGGYHLVWIAWL